MREMDRLTVELCGIPYPTLMETAGSRVVEALIAEYGPVAGKRFWVLCGKGNNGGDGAVIARLLWLRGALVQLDLLGSLDDVHGEARTNLEIARQLSRTAGMMSRSLDGGPAGGENILARLPDHLPEGYEVLADLPLDFIPDFVIDAIFGTGLTRPVEGRLGIMISALNRDRARHNFKIISVDIPSGLPSDSGYPIGPHFQADLTVTFTAPKIGNVDAPACHANGKLVVAGIGTPELLIRAILNLDLELVEERTISGWLQASRRAPDAHKGSVGDVLLIAGSRGKTGAAALAAEAALRSGVGLVTVATAGSAQPLLITQVLNEVMTEALDELESGAISEAAIERAIRLAAKRTALALGPGLSSNEESTRRFVRGTVERRLAPIVIDADGLNALAPWPEDLQGSPELPIVITPHPGEMARLTGRTNAEVVADRIGLARDFAVKNQIITVLKGSRTVIAAPDGAVYLNPTGNAGMATAGSGDVLTGLTVGFLAQAPRDALGATLAAVYLHGLAGDLAAAKLGQRSLVASDLIANLSEALLQVGGDREHDRPQPIITI